ncbi:DUF1461 domain-containing protein [Thalassotalea maritima]|uniref:lipoprotein intramolecular transacylase Lit n=1 Tax=Thalassotalea maritima TaxID=3242416 RepID=UPI0035284D48
MKIIKHLLWHSCSVSLLLCCFGLAWQIAKGIDYGYPWFYDMLAIDQHIATYAPQNRLHKDNFVTTEKAQHLQLFEDIATAINNGGIGLTQLHYRVDGVFYTLLTKDEVIHLQDVANLVDKGKRLWWVNLAVLSSLLVICYRYRLHKPSRRQRIWLVTTVTSLIVALFATFGFKKIFAYLHTLLFPPENPWFFYYQGSLMSTSMKAPDLFAVIGLLLLAITLAIFALLHCLLTKCTTSEK